MKALLLLMKRPMWEVQFPTSAAANAFVFRTLGEAIPILRHCCLKKSDSRKALPFLTDTLEGTCRLALPL